MTAGEVLEETAAEDLSREELIEELERAKGAVLSLQAATVRLTMRAVRAESKNQVLEAALGGGTP